jgi:hypothetical protein
MSRKMILSLAAAATVAVASLASPSADARGYTLGGQRSVRGGGGHLPIGRVTGRAGGPLVPILNPGPSHPIIPIPVRPGHPIIPIPIHPLPPIVLHHHHHHWVFRGGRWIVLEDVVDEAPATVAAVSDAGPCTCLTKTYTPSGLVVFADVCTKESASAQVFGSVGDATQESTTKAAATAVPMSVVPTSPNYAGRSYEDYLAANPQAAQPQAANPPASQIPDNN